jgi:hypothetical protein
VLVNVSGREGEGGLPGSECALGRVVLLLVEDVFDYHGEVIGIMLATRSRQSLLLGLLLGLLLDLLDMLWWWMLPSWLERSWTRTRCSVGIAGGRRPTRIHRTGAT